MKYLTFFITLKNDCTLPEIVIFEKSIDAPTESQGTYYQQIKDPHPPMDLFML